MHLTAGFLEALLRKHTGSLEAHITDASTRILASTEPGRVGAASQTAHYITQVLHPATIENPDSRENDWVTYGTPVHGCGGLWGTVIVHGEASLAAERGNALRIALEAALDYSEHTQSASREPDGTGEIMRLLLEGQVDGERATALLRRREMDPGLLRSVICIHLRYHQNSYFNISLDLGYGSTIEKAKARAVEAIQKSRHINAKDIVYSYDRETVLALKAFHPVPDHSRIYLALDAVCRDLAKELEILGGFSVRMAYGNLYGDIREVGKSYREARETLAIGWAAGNENSVYTMEELLFDTTCHFLHPQVTSKLVQPNLQKLRKKNGALAVELLECGEAFVDHGMSITAASQETGIHRNTIRARLEKLREQTGLDPAASFRDAFVVKMLAVYVRHNGSGGTENGRKRETV